MTIGYCHVKAGDFRMTIGFLITMGGTLNLHKIVDTPVYTPLCFTPSPNYTFCQNAKVRLQNAGARCGNAIADGRNGKKGTVKKNKKNKSSKTGKCGIKNIFSVHSGSS